MQWTFQAYGLYGECLDGDETAAREILIIAIEEWLNDGWGVLG